MPREKMSDIIETQQILIRARDSELSTIKSALSNLYRALDAQYFLDPVDEKGKSDRYYDRVRGGKPRQYVERLIGVTSFQTQKEQIYLAHALAKAEEALQINSVQINKDFERNYRRDSQPHPYDDTYETDTGKRIIGEHSTHPDPDRGSGHSHQRVAEVSLQFVEFQKVRFDTGIMVNVNREYGRTYNAAPIRKDVVMVPKKWIPKEHQGFAGGEHEVVVAHKDNESHIACTDFEHHCWCDGCNADLIEKTKAHFEGGE